MTQIDQDFALWQGEDTVITIPVVDGNGDPKVMTGGTVTWKAWFSKVDTTASLSKTTSDDIALVDSAGTDDAIQITIEKADTTSLTPGEYYHECRVMDSNSKEQVVFEGTMTLHRSKTL